MPARLRSLTVPFVLLGLLGAIDAIAEEAQLTSDSSGDRSTPTTVAGDVPEQFEQATFGSGCFWCSEAVFDQLKGVKSADSGYSGGKIVNPTYEQVSSGLTGHAEVIQVTYDPAVISFAQLLEVFWKTHDPTTLNRQGNDSGTQYRSAIFYHSDEQRKLAEHYKQELDKSGAFDAPIVTEIAPFTKFYPAEKYHQDYFAQNPDEAYCSIVIRPKIDKLHQAFADLLDAPADETTSPSR